MENDPEMIRKQMAETRTSLTEKLETLEQRVVNTVEGASSAVNNVKDAVQETVATVKHSVQDTVGSVRDAFDIDRQVEKRPWTMMAGAVAVGFVGGYLLNRAAASRPAERELERKILDDRWTNIEKRRRGELNGFHTPSQDSETAAPVEQARSDESGVLSHVGQTFEKELGQLKGLAIGAMLGMIRDMARDSVPKPMEQQVGEVIDGITEKLGGQPIQGRLLPKSTAESHRDAVGECSSLG
jgi:ElaB/YqjD/DUF883 family membrane-anchored ribosome-binding protein